MTRKLWFGIPGTHMELLPAPSIESSSSNASYAETIEFENGGGDVRRSSQFRKIFSFAILGTVEETEGINGYSRFSSGFYGDGPFFFVDPYTYGTNVLPPAWASPGLIEIGWQKISDFEPTFVDTVANVYGQPARTAIFDVESADAVVASGSYCTIVIPPGKFLHLGASGSAAGGARVSVLPILSDNSSGSVVDLVLLDPAGATRMNTVFSGDTYQAVTIYLPSSTIAGSVIQITSMMAQITDTDATPSVSNHIHGEGHTGVEFISPAVIESYVYIDPPRKGTAFDIMEVEAWR